jgi:hypothetical protein
MQQQQPVAMEPPPRMPDPQPSQNQPHLKQPNYAPIQQSQPKPSMQQSAPRVSAKTGNEDDDLEIPAFIRKKMM